MKKIQWSMIAIAASFAIITVVAYLYIGPLLEWAARKAINFVSCNLAKSGIEIQDPDFDGVSMGLFPTSVSVNGFSAHMVITQHNVFQIDRNFYLKVEKVSVSLESLAFRSFLISIKDVAITLQNEYNVPYRTVDKKENYDRLEINKLDIRFKLNAINRNIASDQAKSLIKDLADFAKSGTTQLAMRLTGASAFVVRKTPVRSRLLLTPLEKGYKLVMDPKDFKMISMALEEKLTANELETYSRNPLRLPRMLRIRNYASDKAREEHNRNDDISEDAYKHILWAFLLSKAYDEKFSTEVTDSHEINAVGGNELAARAYLHDERGISESAYEKSVIETKTEPEIQMDLINNMIGREYAANNYAEASIIDRMMKDPRVVMTSRDVDESDLADAVSADKK